LNINTSINNNLAHRGSLQIGKNLFAQNRTGAEKSVETRRDIENLSKTQNRSAINHDKSSTDKISANQTNPSARSTSKINPILLDKVFKLKAKEEQTEISTNRRSDLYLQTEIISSSKLADLGIGLDLYV